MHVFRTHNCNDLNQKQVGQRVKLSGWVHRRRDHGNLLFIDLRDNSANSESHSNCSNKKPAIIINPSLFIKPSAIMVIPSAGVAFVINRGMATAVAAIKKISPINCSQ